MEGIIATYPAGGKLKILCVKDGYPAGGMCFRGKDLHLVWKAARLAERAVFGHAGLIDRNEAMRIQVRAGEGAVSFRRIFADGGKSASATLAGAEIEALLLALADLGVPQKTSAATSVVETEKEVTKNDNA